MKYRFSLPPAIESDIYACADYIARSSPQRAIDWVDHIIERLVSIADLPHACPVSEDETKRLGLTVRKLAIGNYVAFYHVDDAARLVKIVGFRHAARSPDAEMEC